MTKLLARSAVLVLFVGLCWTTPQAWAVPTVSVDVDPGTAGVQSSGSVSLSSSFSIDVFISGVDPNGLNAFELDLSFDPTIVTATSVVDGGFLAAPVFEVQNSIGAMTVMFAEVTLGLGSAVGSGVLATIAFDTVGVGTSALDLSNVVLSAPFGIPIQTAAVNDGSVDVAAAAVPEPHRVLLLVLGLTLLMMGSLLRRHHGSAHR